MPKSIQTIIDSGSKGIIVDVECHISNGLPGMIIVGLGNKAIDEAKERIRSACASSGIPLPRKRITINLAPADIPKVSTSLDLSIAATIFQSEGCKRPFGKDCAIIGELGLAGDVKPVRGIIGKLLHGKRAGIKHFLIPVGNYDQAALVPGITITPINTVQELYAGMNQQIEFAVLRSDHSPKYSVSRSSSEHTLSEIVGQKQAKRALEIAAAGGHNLFLSGPPGTGKSMLAKALPSILPPLSREEMLEITHLHSLVAGQYDKLVQNRPFRAPHHSASHVAIVGGGNSLRPGEITLAHHGVLFFDELPEFGRCTIEALRQPLEDGNITVARAKDTALFPAKFILVATANPCPCGYFGTAKTCTCPPHRIAQYRQKLSGPIMDRIDLHVESEEINHSKLLNSNEENVEAISKRVIMARTLQARRYGCFTKLNATMTNQDIKKYSSITPDGHQILNTAAAKLDISARSYMRVIKVARTIADLDKSEKIHTKHISEALQYRPQNLQTLGLG